MRDMERLSQGQRVIDRFTKEAGYEFLSNFHPSTVRFEGVLYPTVEHAYQASKTLDPKLRELIRKNKDPSVAKKLGQGIIVRENWQEDKIEIMRALIREKFENPFLRPKLLATEDAELILNNKWNDRFWGVCRGSGENWLGKILMEERERIKKEVEREALQAK
jgi:ribA/ribD-fused uncharacterized protein